MFNKGINNVLWRGREEWEVSQSWYFIRDFTDE